MELSSAIEALESPDAEVFSEAIEICKMFQSASGFDVGIFQELISQEDPKFRAFAFNSLSILMQNEWNQTGSEIQEFISSFFPFFNEISEEDPIIFIVFRCTAVYLSRIADYEQIVTFLQSESCNLNVFKEFLIQIFTESFPQDRSPIIQQIIQKNIYEIIFNKLIFPLSQEIDESLYAEIVDCLGQLHDISESVNDSILAIPDVDQIYSVIAHNVWNFQTNPGLISILMNALSSNQSVEQTANELVGSAIAMIPENYGILFLTEGEIDEGMAEEYINDILSKIQLLFLAMPKLEVGQISEVFRFISVLFSSSAPSFILNVAKYLSQTLRYNVFQTEEYAEALQQDRLMIVEICSNILAKKMETLFLANCDTEWNIDPQKTPIYQLIETISDVFDCNVLIEGITQMIISSDIKDPNLYGLVRLLIVIMPKEVTEEFAEAENEQLTTIFNILLTNIRQIAPAVRDVAFKLLVKIQKFIQLNASEATEIFNILLQLLIESKCRPYNPFATFFIDFSINFIEIINFPIEALQGFDNSHPSYWVTRLLLARISSITDNYYLGDAIEQSIATIGQFVENGLDTFGTSLSSVLEFVLLVPGKFFDETTYEQILTLLLQAMNMIIAESDRIGMDTEEDKSLTKISHIFGRISAALLHLCELVPTMIVNVFEGLSLPSSLNDITFSWCKDIAAPLLKVLSENDSEACASIAEHLASHLIGVISNDTAEMQHIAFKISSFICNISVFTSDETAAQIIGICIDIDNSNVFNSVVDAIAARSFDFLLLFWPKLMERKEKSCVDAICMLIYGFIEKNEFPIEAVEKIPGVKQEAIETLSLRLQAAAAPRTRRKHIRNFILSILL